MFKYMLTQQVYDGTDFGNVEVIGTFGEIDNVNEFLRSSPDYPDYIKFISCRQIIEFSDESKCYKLDLITVPFNPIDKLGQVRKVMRKEKTILDLLEADGICGDPLTANDDTLITVTIKNVASSEIFFSFETWGISLLEDGTWHFEES